MPVAPNGVSVPAQSKSLDTTVVTTSYGVVHRQVVVFGDPEDPDKRVTVGANGAYVDVRNVAALPLPSGASTAANQTTINTSVQAVTTSLGTDGASPPSIAGTGVRGWLREIYDRLVAGLDRTWTLSSGTDSVSAVQSGAWNITNVSGTISLPTGAATASNQATANNSLSSIDGKIPDESGTWSYIAGTSGSPSISGSKRVLQITAIGGSSGGTLTINGGNTITIPALTSITISPRANLTDPALVFTSTSSYFVEMVV